MPDRTTPLRLILYIDEINPGNPLRPDKARTTQAIYDCFADWPQWALQRSSVWLLFGVIRTSLVLKLPAGISQLMRYIMNVFFSKDGQSFTRGCLINYKGESVLVRAAFTGFLADEKAHKEIWECKGASGTKPCISCKNVTRFLDVVDHDYLVGIDVIDYRRMDPHTNETVFAMADRLHAVKIGGVTSKKDFEAMQQMLGLNYHPEGILNDAHLRSIIRPVDHTLRDWMHVFVSGGVAGTELSLLIQEMRKHGVTEAMLVEFGGRFKFPRAQGKLDTSVWTDSKIGDESLRAFASEILSMLPIMSCFLSEVVGPLNILPEHVSCFQKLVKVIQILSMGPHAAVSQAGTLQAAIVDHHTSFRRLYPEHIKPKFHHGMHIPHNITYAGVLMSCFVTERKHRAVKREALTIFRYYEHTLVASMVNQQAEDFRVGLVLQGTTLKNPREVRANGTTLLTAKGALLPCGEVHADDLLALEGKQLGRAHAFWQEVGRSDIVIELFVYRCTAPDYLSWSANGGRLAFVRSEACLAPVVWAAKIDGVRIIQPRAWQSE